MSKPVIKEAIVVEGKYDKNVVLQVVDAVVVETGGFSVFSNAEKIKLLRKLADSRGIIIMTDGDGAGFLIRGHLKGKLGSANIRQAYIPDVYGKEHRKTQYSAEGKLGVEGMTPEVILQALRRAGATFLGEDQTGFSGDITPTTLFECGLSGGESSSVLRASLLRSLELPERMGAKAMCELLNALMTREQLIQAVESLK